MERASASTASLTAAVFTKKSNGSTPFMTLLQLLLFWGEKKQIFCPILFLARDIISKIICMIFFFQD